MAEQDPKEVKELVKFVENIKHQWMSTIDALIDPMMIVHKDYSISKANLAMAKHANMDIKDVLKKKCYEVFAGRSSPCSDCHMRQATESKEPQHFDLEDVRERNFEVTSQPLYDREGQLDGIVQVYRDRTEAKELQAQLLQSEKLASIGLLAGGVAHEINNPLGGILVFSQMLMREMDENSPHRPDVEEIYQATQRCKAIVENLLDFARTKSAKKRTTEPESVDVIEAVKTALRFGRVGVAQADIDIVENLPTQAMNVKADRNKVIQLFLNLIQNALQAMPDGGSLTINAFAKKSKGQDYTVVEIADTGVGIPDAYLKKIFDPFFTTKEPGEGTGLGLAICYGIAQELGGDLTVESRLDQGTVFSVFIPTTAAKVVEAS